MPITTAMTSALAALCGSTIGALAPIMNSYLGQKGQLQRDVLLRDLEQRQTLYSTFITEAARVYPLSIMKTLEDPEEIVPLFALASRIRLIASDPVVSEAEAVVRKVVVHYGEPNQDAEVIRKAVLEQSEEPLKAFSLACRREISSLR